MSAHPPAGVLGLDQPTDRPAIRLLTTTGPDPDWRVRHEGLVRDARQGGVDLYLQGDSLTDLWSLQFEPHFKKTFGGWRTGNFSIRGDRTEHVLWRLQNGAMDGVEPKAVMLTIGTNNLPSLQGVYSAKQPEEVAAGVRAILGLFQKRWPAARILLPSIPPREDRLQALPPAVPEDLNPKIRELNTLIARMADGENVKFVNMHDAFLDAKGKLRPNVLFDKLHPGEAGYDLWAAAITPILTQWLGHPRK